MNVCKQRCNCALQEDSVGYEEDLLLEDLRLFNQRLFNYLDCYNGQRPHQVINYRTPCQMLAQRLPRLSHMWWLMHHTHLSKSGLLQDICAEVSRLWLLISNRANSPNRVLVEMRAASA